MPGGELIVESAVRKSDNALEGTPSSARSAKESSLPVIRFPWIALRPNQPFFAPPFLLPLRVCEKTNRSCKGRKEEKAKAANTLPHGSSSMPWNPDRYHQFTNDGFAPFDELFALVKIRDGLRVV